MFIHESGCREDEKAAGSFSPESPLAVAPRFQGSLPCVPNMTDTRGNTVVPPRFSYCPNTEAQGEVTEPNLLW